MNTSRKTRVWFFAGPTLSPREILAACASVAADVRVLPPIQQGDLLRGMNDLPDVVGIIDGYFHQVPAVLHKEILLALEHGARVLGAASLGALRAAELDAFGMEGIGEIYRLYKEGHINGDDEVAVVHASQEERFRSLTVPLVNIRHNIQLATARGLISPRTASLVLSIARRVHFTERTYDKVLRAARARAASSDEWTALQGFLESEAVDLKHQDALALMRVVAERLRGAQPWPPRVAFRLEKTKYFGLHERDYAGHVCEGRHVPDKLVLSLQKLLSKSFPDLHRRIALRCLAVDEALHRGLASQDEESLRACFRRSRDLLADAEYHGWLRDNFLSEPELLAWLRQCDLEERLLTIYRANHPRSRTDSDLQEHLLTDVAERTGLDEQELTGPLFRPPGILWEEPLIRELKLRDEFRPALALACRLLDFDSRLFDGNPDLRITYDALLHHARDHLEKWIAAQWRILDSDWRMPSENAVLFDIRSFWKWPGSPTPMKNIIPRVSLARAGEGTQVEKPSLIVVGTGIRVIGQMTTESIAWIKVAEKVLHLVYDPTAAEIISDLNSSAESLAHFYAEGKPRRESLQEMVDRVMECVRSGMQTCLAILGHPGVFSWLGHEVVRQARDAGYTAKMLPAISAADCLFADLGLDPGTTGCQSYEAMDFLRNGRQVDPSSLLLLWQIGAIGDPLYKTTGYDLAALPLLVERLCRTYDPDHTVIVYVAPISWGAEPSVERVPLGRLADARLFAGATLCIPPGQATRPDMEMCKRLNLPVGES